MNWQSITVQQFQQLYKISISKADDIDKSTQAIAVLYNMTEAEVDEMDLLKYKQLCAETTQFLDVKQIPGQPEARIGAYKIIYNPAKLKHRQYVEINHWMDNRIENMHLIMASLVKPTKWRYWTTDNKAEDHERYANDILQLPVSKVYHACVFFCNLYNALIKVTADFLKSSKTATPMEKQAAQLLRNATAGYSVPNK